MSDSPRDQLSQQQVADLLGIKVETVRVHRRRGAIPEPDGYVARSPWWFRRTIDKWLTTRPQRGWNDRTHKHLSKHSPGGTNGKAPAQRAKRSPRELAAAHHGTREDSAPAARAR